MSMRILIADDEPVARRRIRRLLRSQADVDVVAEAGDGRAAVDAIYRLAPDLVFLDVQMPELDGFGVVSALPPPRPAIVFVTAFDHYALRAFEIHALDYLLKPFTRERFEEAFARARRPKGADVDAALTALVDSLADRLYLTRLAVKDVGRIRLVDADDIEWIRAADNYVVVRAAGHDHLVRDTMDRLERELDPRRFVRIHRSTIVHIKRIKELRPALHGDMAIVMRDGTRFTLSRSYRERVSRVLGI